MIEPSVNSTEALAGLHILVVEDEVLVAMMLEDVLNDFGCNVELASNIETALEVIRDIDLNGVLLDMNLQGQKTIVIAEELVRRGVPFLLVTGYAVGGEESPAIKDAPRLQKPFSLQSLALKMTGAFITDSGVRTH